MEVYEGGNQQGQKRPPSLPPGLVKKLIIGIIAVVIVLFGFSMFYTLEETEKAMILTFGKYTGEESEAGLKFKLPYPIQQVEIYPAYLTQEVQIGYRENEPGQIDVVENESLMITGDENLISVDAVVEWNVADLRDFFYNIDDPEQFIRNAATSAIRSAIGENRLDYAITDGKAEIQGQVMERLLEMMDKYESGIHVVSFKFQDIEPPSGEVQQAFKEVTNAREEKNTKINQANQYVNQKLPVARGEAQAMLEHAEGEKQRRILNAQGDVANFNALYEAYVSNPDVTESRLILETLEKILPGAKIVITNNQGDVVNYLPLNELMRGSGSSGTGGSGSSSGSSSSGGTGSSSGGAGTGQSSAQGGNSQ